jgi:hypothetical protein
MPRIHSPYYGWLLVEAVLDLNPGGRCEAGDYVVLARQATEPLANARAFVVHASWPVEGVARLAELCRTVAT